MELPNEDIESIKNELLSLRQENRQLKKVIRQMQQKEEFEGFELIRSTYHPTKNIIENQKTGCPHCSHCKKPPQKSRKQLVEEFQMWSHRLNNSFPMKKHLSDIHEDEQKNSITQVEQQEQGQTKIDPLIQHICLYGPNLQQMRKSQKNEKVEHQLYFPNRDPVLQSYGNYFYPQKCGFKVVRQKKKDVDIDKILFRKSFKQQDCSIFIFFQSNGDEQVPKNKILKQINPFKTLYSIGLQFSDYIFSNEPYQYGIDKSLSISEDRFEQLHQNEDIVQQNKKQNNIYGQTCIFKGNFYLSIFTYFPFIDFYCQLLIRIIDQIKIKRMQKQSQKGKNYSQLDINYVAKQIDNILKQISPLLYAFILMQGQKLNLKFGSQNINLILQNNNILQLQTYDWLYRILRIFDKDTLYQIYCLVMLEQTLCIICQNTYILTFTIHLLVSILTKPFRYPHPIVTIVFQQQFLQTPFTTMLGINKGNKWFQSNEDIFIQKIKDKIILNLNDDEVKIKSKRKYRLPKSQKLKKIFNNFYKKVQKYDNTSSKKRQYLNRQINKYENDLALKLIIDLQNYYKQQLLNYMPNKQIIDCIRNNISNDNLTIINTKLIKNIQQYIKQSRKIKQYHDAMIQSIMNKQIFYVYLTQRYDI